MTKRILLVFAVIASIVAMETAAPADVPQLISFQGKLHDNTGNPLTGTYQITFRIYNVASGGIQLWTETSNVICDNGLYNVILGLTTPMTIAFDGEYWLGVQVTGDTELAPRFRIVSVPVAIRAAVADVAQQVSWNNLTDVPAGFADGADDVGASSGVSQINAGTGITVTNPTGPTATIAHTADASALPNAHHTKTTSASELTSGTLDNARFSTYDDLNAEGKIGSGSDQLAAGDHNHTDVYSPVEHNHDAEYVNEGQPNSVASGMIVNGTIQQEDLSFTPAGDNDWTIVGNDIYHQAGKVGIGTTNPEYPLTATGDNGDPIVMVTNNGYGHAVQGVNVDNFGCGIYGEGTGHMGEGVYGIHSNGNYGFLGDNDYGIYGENVNGGTGIAGYSSNGDGVSGGSTSERGVFGFSSNGDGVVGFNIGSLNKGMLGGSSFGVRGESSSGWAGIFADRVRIGEDPSYSTVYGELRHDGAGTGFKINANAGGGGWGDLHFQTNGTTRMFLESGGNFGIGTTSPSYRLHIVGDIGYTGNIYDVSDIRLKENIVPLANAVEKISSIRSIYFNNKGEPPEEREVGVIAQEVEKVLPEVVSENAEGYKSVDYSKLTPLLIEAIKEQQAQIKTLRAEIAEIEARIK